MKKILILLLATFVAFEAQAARIELPTINFGDLFSSIDYLKSDARRGGGGFGGSRGFRSSPSRSRGSGAFSGNRSRSTRPSSSARSRANNFQSSPKQPAFGGKRMTPTQAKSKYGVPRKTQTVTGKNASGQSQQYVMHNYGGFSSGLMTGYMMGATSWLWFTPFHGAFYYSRPVYATNPDGTVSVYPPTFNWAKFFVILLIVGVIIYFIRKSMSKNSESSTSSSGSFG